MRHIVMYPPSSPFNVLELLALIIDSCTVKSCHNLALTSKLQHDVIEDQYKCRIERELLAWFPHRELIHFWAGLDESSVVVGGLVALNVIFAIAGINCLDIFMPKNNEPSWETFLTSLGWNHVFSDSAYSRCGGSFVTQWWSKPRGVSFILV